MTQVSSPDPRSSEEAGQYTGSVNERQAQQSLPYSAALAGSMYHDTGQANPATSQLHSYMEPALDQGRRQRGPITPSDVHTQYSGYQSISASPELPSASCNAPGVDGVRRPDLDANDIANMLGELNITDEAVAPYIVNQRKALMGIPAVKEHEVYLSQDGADRAVRIPPEMMPSEQQALEHFSYFFAHIHPYTPVIHRESFYKQWHSDRQSISPLLLEAIFACSSLTLGDGNRGGRWLALASS